MFLNVLFLVAGVLFLLADALLLVADALVLLFDVLFLLADGVFVLVRVDVLFLFAQAWGMDIFTDFVDLGVDALPDFLHVVAFAWEIFVLLPEDFIAVAGCEKGAMLVNIRVNDHMAGSGFGFDFYLSRYGPCHRCLTFCICYGFLLRDFVHTYLARFPHWPYNRHGNGCRPSMRRT